MKKWNQGKFTCVLLKLIINVIKVKQPSHIFRQAQYDQRAVSQSKPVVNICRTIEDYELIVLS